MTNAEERLVKTISDRLSELGTTAYAVEQRLGLPQDAIRNVLRPREGAKSGPTYSRVAEICAALDLELFVGHQRPASPIGFAEATAAAWAGAGATKAVTDVFKKGYLPFPWHDLARKSEPPPVVLSLAWLEENNLAPGDLRFVDLPDHPDGPTLALVDERGRLDFGSGVWVWKQNKALFLDWGVRDDGGPFYVMPGGDAKRGYPIPPAEHSRLQFLGRAVWSARLEPVPNE